MKKILLALVFAVSSFGFAQVQQNTPPQISVAGEGKVTVVPDEAEISIGVSNTGSDANTVKKANDAAIDAILKYLKAQKLDAKDIQTERVSLNRYETEKKKFQYNATQTISIHLRDLSRYDAIMMGVMDAGANTINGVTFKTSKEEQYKSEARMKAVADARKKADDYTKALGQKLGKALLVTDNSQTYYPMVRTAMYKEAAAMMDTKETLAPGEITIAANVSISYGLE